MKKIKQKINIEKNEKKIKDLINIWEKNYIKSDKTLPLYKYVKYLKSINSITILKQKKLESFLVIKNKVQEDKKKLHILFNQNKTIKKYYYSFKDYITNDFDKIFLKVKSLKCNIYNEFLKKNTDILAFNLFEAISTCIKLKNIYWSTLYSHIVLYVKKTFKNSKESTIYKCNYCDIEIIKKEYNKLNKVSLNMYIFFNKSTKVIDQKLFEYTTNAIINAAEWNGVINRDKIEKNTKNNMSIIFKLNDEISAFLNRILINIMFKPPMILKPKKWKMYKKNKIAQYSGGYYSNFFMKLNIESDKSIKFNKKFLNSINYLQEVSISINIKYLKWIENNNMNLIYNNFNSITVKDVNNFLDEKFKDISFETLNIINEIVSTLYYAKLFSKFKNIYLPMHYDFRGRIYCSSYPLHYYSTDLFRGLYVFSTPHKINEKSFYDFFLKNTDNKKKFIEIYNKNKQLYSLKDYYLYKSISCSKENSMIGVDASSSAFQIQGLLIKDMLMMKLSNVIPNDHKHDIYKHVMNEFRLYINKNNDLLINYMHEINKEHSNKFTINIWHDDTEFNSFMYNLLNDREIWKAVIMRLGYNQMIKSRTEELSELIKNKYIKILNFKYNDKNKYINKYFNKLLWFLSLSIEKVFYDIFPKQKILKKIFSTTASIVTKRNDEIIFITSTVDKNNSHIVGQLYHKKKWHDIYYYNRTLKKKCHIAFCIDNISQVDINKSRISTLPNYIQYLDSVIMSNVVNSCESLKIDIKCIHDNFLIHFKNINKVRNFYVDALVDIFVANEDTNNDILYDFLIKNNVFKEYNIFILYYEIMKDYIIIKFYFNNTLVYTLNKENIKMFKKKYLKYEYKIVYLSNLQEIRDLLYSKSNNYILTW